MRRHAPAVAQVALVTNRDVGLGVAPGGDTDVVGKFDFTLAGNKNDTEVTRVPSTTVLSALSPSPALFARINRVTFEEGTPDSKIEPTATATLSPDINLETLDKPEEPDLNWNVYMPLLTRSESFKP